jgi:hypothetical protein
VRRRRGESAVTAPIVQGAAARECRRPHGRRFADALAPPSRVAGRATHGAGPQLMLRDWVLAGCGFMIAFFVVRCVPAPREF